MTLGCIQDSQYIRFPLGQVYTPFSCSKVTFDHLCFRDVQIFHACCCCLTHSASMLRYKYWHEVPKGLLSAVSIYKELSPWPSLTSVCAPMATHWSPPCPSTRCHCLPQCIPNCLESMSYLNLAWEKRCKAWYSFLEENGGSGFCVGFEIDINSVFLHIKYAKTN